MLCEKLVQYILQNYSLYYFYTLQPCSKTCNLFKMVKHVLQIIFLHSSKYLKPKDLKRSVNKFFLLFINSRPHDSILHLNSK